MRHKLKVVDVEAACQCPFYMKDTGGKSSCLIKLTTTPQILTSLLESDDHSDFDYWDMDCGGEWSNCSVLPLLYRFKEDEEEQVAPMSKNEQAIEDYNPFGDSENPDDYPDEPESPIITIEPTQEVAVKAVELESYPTKFTIHMLKNPYLVKGDVLVYPTNNQLYIDDMELRRMLRGLIDNEINGFLQKPIRMGKIYVTSNGGEKSMVKAKHIYHAVVAGTSRLVNEQDVGDSTFKALARASIEGHKSVILMPSDCGTLDIYATAMVQLGAVKQFLMSHPETKLEHIFMVMADQLSYDVFNKYNRRIFKKRKSIQKQAVTA
jgi:O-acetyl-ADP-ribose deacetylase (regulator of RNase III)